ncbi:MAG: hypothetical protein QME78_00050 [Thermodesulfobacteriota bacterium]|nr:hypothetical protein [Thermodesulfobacteriota bacterium]
MADLAATDVTVTLSPQDKDFLGAKRVSYPSIAFGGAGKTYGAVNGIPMPAIGKFGMNKEIKRVFVMQPGNGYEYRWDRANHKLRIFQAAPTGSVAAPTFTGSALGAHVHDLLIKGGITADENLGLLASGPTLGKSEAADRIVAGANYATKGGVASITGGVPAGTNSAPVFTGAAAPLAEAPSSHAPAATSIELMVVGE